MSRTQTVSLNLRNNHRNLPKKTLVIDNEADILEICGDYFKSAGYEVLTAEDGLKGLSLSHHEKPDLIVLDLILPEMDRLQLCRAIRHDSDVPIIILTARAEENDKLLGLELGADD